MKLQHQSAIKRAASDYIGQLKLEWRSTTLVSILPGIGSVLVFYVPPLVIASLLQRFDKNQLIGTNDLLPYLLLFAGIWGVGEILWRITIHLMIRMEIRSMTRLYIGAMNEMLRRDLSFFHNNFAGSLTKKTLAYARHFETFLDTLIFNVVSQVIPLIFISYILWQFSPWLVLGLVGMMIITIGCVAPLIIRRQKLVNVRETASNVVSGYIADIYSNIDAVRAFGNEKHESVVYAAHVKDFMRKSQASWDYQNMRVDVVTSPLYVLTNLTGMVLALTLGRSSGLDISAVFVTFTYYAGFTRIMWEFNRIYRQIESALSEAAQFTELLFEEPTVYDAQVAVNHSIKQGVIEMRDVNFRYNDSRPDLLFERLNLSIARGEKVGLVGHSGGGKTTITKLLLRFVNLNDGQILIDGQDIATISQSSLRAGIAYVPQDPVMFHRSLEDNIRYGKLDASKKEINEVAKQAHALEFIKQLPQGFETLVGERGVKLSGGQRQRVAIARAMIKDAPILILDEATSALDSESEVLIQDALWKLMEGRTAIVIAHRLSTIQKMDRIIVLDEGSIVEEGSHKELLNKNGVYATLWAHQSGGFLEE